MVAPIGLYTQLTHDRPQDYEMMVNGKVRTVLILQPDANMVCKVWDKIKNNPGAKVILRVWDWDDGRRYEGDLGVYKRLRDEPAALGRDMVDKFSDLIKNMRQWADSEGKDFPRNDQILCHLVNEPDTNIYERQIVTFTDAAVRRAEKLSDKIYLLCFNFGTGHPAKQVGGAGTDPDWSPYQRTIDLINQYGHWIGLHEYYNDQGMRSPSTNPWHILRHTMQTALIALAKSKVIIAEYGLEMLVNNAGPDHHGWMGIIPARQFGEYDLRYYASNVAAFVQDILIYANDLPDRTWNTFDSVPAKDFVVPTMLWALDEYNEGGGTIPEPPEKPTSELIWPCDGIMTQRFGENPENYIPLGSPAHNGIDIANPSGTLILSVADGTVEWVDYNSGYGNYVRIWHPQYNMHSFYAHLLEQLVKGGDSVKSGQAIGKMGNTGNSTGPHLHFETRFGERTKYWNVTEGYGNGRANPEAVYAAYGMQW